MTRLPTMHEYATMFFGDAVEHLAFRRRYRRSSRGPKRSMIRIESEATGALKRALMMALRTDDLGLRCNIREAMAELGRDGSGRRIKSFRVVPRDVSPAAMPQNLPPGHVAMEHAGVPQERAEPIMPPTARVERDAPQRAAERGVP